jgi:predicted dinucleotide-utilizing enzyme
MPVSEAGISTSVNIKTKYFTATLKIQNVQQKDNPETSATTIRCEMK